MESLKHDERCSPTIDDHRPLLVRGNLHLIASYSMITKIFREKVRKAERIVYLVLC